MNRLLVILATFLTFLSQGQEGMPPKHVAYYEFGGAGGVGSLNYEHSAVSKNKLESWVRVGVGTLKLMDFRNQFNPDLTIVFNAIGTYGGRNKIEIYTGGVFASTVVAKSIDKADRVIEQYLNIGGGYRFEAESTGFFGKAGYYFLTNLSDKNTHWAGLSIGIIIQ